MVKNSKHLLVILIVLSVSGCGTLASRWGSKPPPDNSIFPGVQFNWEQITEVKEAESDEEKYNEGKFVRRSWKTFMTFDLLQSAIFDVVLIPFDATRSYFTKKEEVE